MRLSGWAFLATVVSAACLCGAAAAQDVMPTGYVEERDAFSSELRFRLFTNAFRWSTYTPEASSLPDPSLVDSGKRSLHGVFGLGARFYPKSAHGVLVDFEYRLDLDLDSSSGWLCIFECAPQLWTEFALAHVGYAYRHVIPGPRNPGRLAWAFTPHASLTTGGSFTDASTPSSRYYESSRSAVIGARLGIDVDLHINRFFMGWTLRYDVLRHTKGPLRLTHFVSYNLIPVFAIGAVLGGKVQG